MTARFNATHKKVIADFCEGHPSIITNRFVGPSGRDESRMAWDSLTIKLNSLGFGMKTVAQWKKVVADLKSKIKSRAARHHKARVATGGGSLPDELVDETFDESDYKLLAIMGPTCYKGDDNEELGLSRPKISSEVDLPRAHKPEASCRMMLLKSPTQERSGAS